MATVMAPSFVLRVEQRTGESKASGNSRSSRGECQHEGDIIGMGGGSAESMAGGSSTGSVHVLENPEEDVCFLLPWIL